LRPLFFRGEQRRRCVPAKPSEEGGLEELVEFFLRVVSWRCRSAICFSASAICFSASAICFSASVICRSPFDYLLAELLNLALLLLDLPL
jgi:hypothetical protein